MPTITIREEDLTSAGVDNVSTNAVYIPGYAVTGPINTPTLCETLEDFQVIFGTTPYIFKNDQPWDGLDFANNAVPTGTNVLFAEAGDYEKSYIMASELLRQGLPVYYERVFSGDIDKWIASTTIAGDGDTTKDDDETVTNLIVIKAASPGAVGADIKVAISSIEVVMSTAEAESATSGKAYEVTVSRDANSSIGTPAISPVVTKFTFDPNVADRYSSITYYRDLKIDNSGLVTFTFNGATDNSSISNMDVRNLAFSSSGSEEEFTVSGMYTFLKTNGKDGITQELQGFDRLADRGEYVLKYITSGAYPIFEYNNNNVTSTMLTVAADRGDAIALIDHTPKNDRYLSANNESSVVSVMRDWCGTTRPNDLGESVYPYGAMYTPWALYDNSVIDDYVELPASFAYLISLAVSVQTNPNWYAVAGVTRGSVPNIISLSQNITNAIADSYASRDEVSINPITNIRPYGLVIWGNRTLKNNALAGGLTATSFMNVRQLICDLKRQIFVTAKRLTYEQNNDVLWINFKAGITPLLEQMLNGNGITGYQLIKQPTTERATLKARVVIQVIEAVEDFDITVSLTDTEATVTE